MLGFVRPRLATAGKYAKAELLPPGPGELAQLPASLINGVKGLLRPDQVTVRRIVLNGIVCADVLFFFALGECIGKGSLIGYDIPGATNWDTHWRYHDEWHAKY